MNENYRMYSNDGDRTDNINYAVMIVIDNDEGVDEVRELLKKNDECYNALYRAGVYWWDDVLDSYRLFCNYEVDMFKKVFATL